MLVGEPSHDPYVALDEWRRIRTRSRLPCFELRPQQLIEALAISSLESLSW